MPSCHLNFRLGSNRYQTLLKDVIFQHIINERKRYANQQIAENKNSNPLARNLKKMIAIDVKPAIKLYWSTDPFMEHKLFLKTMSMNRVMQIIRFIHFNDSHNAH